MKITIHAIERVPLGSFAERHDLEMEVREYEVSSNSRLSPNGVCFEARFKGVTIGGGLASFGYGPSAILAIQDYARKIQGKTILVGLTQLTVPKRLTYSPDAVLMEAP